MSYKVNPFNPKLASSNTTQSARLLIADSKREEFRKYLEKAGVMDVLTRVLVGLYEEPEKPSNALDFLKHHLGMDEPEQADVEALKLELNDLRCEVERLTEENKCLRCQLGDFEEAEAAEEADLQQPPAAAPAPGTAASPTAEK